MNDNKQVLIFGFIGASVCDFNKDPKEVKLEGECSQDIWWAWGGSASIISWDRQVGSIRVWNPETGRISSSYSFSKLSEEPILKWQIDQNRLFYIKESHLKGFDLNTCSPLDKIGNISLLNPWKIIGDFVFCSAYSGTEVFIQDWQTGKQYPPLTKPSSSTIEQVYFVGRKIFIGLVAARVTWRAVEHDYRVIQWSEKK